MTDDIVNYMDNNKSALVNLYRYKYANEAQVSFAVEMLPLLSVHLFDQDEKIDHVILATNYRYLQKVHCYSKENDEIYVYPFSSSSFYYVISEKNSDVDMKPIVQYFNKRKFYCKK